MPIRIIDNKRIDITEDEFSLYQKICRSYDRTNFKGEELFRNIFETDDDGVIIFITPPSNRQFTMECFMFVVTLMHQQHLRVFYKTLKDYLKSADDKLKEQANLKIEEFTNSINGKLQSLNFPFIEEIKSNYKESVSKTESALESIKKEASDSLNSKKEEIYESVKKEVNSELSNNIDNILNNKLSKFEELLNTKSDSIINNFKDSLKSQLFLDLEKEKAKMVSQLAVEVKEEILKQIS